ncbi:MAG: nitrogenase-stabilizing/protective protein NifW [Sulfuricurvum sp.]|uniref:nitrogenase-stabilizing/protective protein NifW n=1 Tax=Sulfuricurvum sp. TaxID=2025608 RepID=UPI0026100551|nr:nitrogenase-stabilizing/protective protein NifW [Sulfuricurvum sp.]MDD2370118.1 nitrogenase-stabilizing/protective protein NifW [Sulfuricurvum sp.]MDD2950876.1 nitrogenase-stabilizing/protective protein NifW [Sulfuricurvum sp.]MDD5119408.1 nitrogenase-stabilizing/protective protein NifW [Sulfuricurvum sp.]
MGTLAEFQKITDTEDFFDFFDLEYDERLVNAKRFHIMKKFGELVDKSKDHDMGSDEKLLEFYKFALITVYKNFENGYSPSAADVWAMFDKPSACGTCSTSSSCNDVEEVSHGVHACTSQTNISF